MRGKPLLTGASIIVIIRNMSCNLLRLKLSSVHEQLIATNAYLTIDFTHVNFSDARVLGNFSQHSSITTANDKNLLGFLVGK